ncbi:unnamed protein product [Absidia cylindrospora]
MVNLTQENESLLIKYALEAKETAYVPYSNFRVGAALLTKDGVWYKGCNVENASYGATICAERTAFCKAVSEGDKDFIALGVSSDQNDLVTPCGICRQFISEFAPSSLPVYLIKANGSYKKVTLDDLLPNSFTLPKHENIIT